MRWKLSHSFQRAVPHVAPHTPSHGLSWSCRGWATFPWCPGQAWLLGESDCVPGSFTQTAEGGGVPGDPDTLIWICCQGKTTFFMSFETPCFHLFPCTAFSVSFRPWLSYSSHSSVSLGPNLCYENFSRPCLHQEVYLNWSCSYYSKATLCWQERQN